MNKIFFEMKCTGGCVYRALTKWVNYGAFRKRARYARYYKKKKVQKNIVLYESFFGRGMLCNPYAIFLQLLQEPEFHHFKHVWVLDKIENHTILIEEFSKYSNVVFIQRESRKYLKYLCKAKYLVNNVSFPSYFIKKPEQIYLNTWHGIPMKHVCYDVPNGNIVASNIIRDFLHTDFLLAANPFMVKIYKDTFKLHEIYQGKIIKEGYPRLDILYQFSREQVLQKLKKYGVHLDSSKKIILYAPTWRGVSYTDVSININDYYSLKKQLEQQIDTTRYQILIKVHQRVYEVAKEKLTENFIIPAMIDANEVLCITDILISDFSSIYFDFLTTGRPILFFIEDEDQYAEERGFYLGLNSLPGPHTDTISTLAKWINTIETIQDEYAEKYRSALEWSTGMWHNSIAKKIVDIIFRGQENKYHVIQETHIKKHILIHCGVVFVNGVFSALISLLNNLDYEHYDVSLMVCGAKTIEEKKLVNEINPNVRVLYRNSTYNATIMQEICLLYRYRHSIYNPNFSLLRDDFLRSYGNVSFDYAIDFEGYNRYFSSLLLQCPKAIKSIWMHSDMLAECDRIPGLENYFRIYQYFDRIVSCSKAAMSVNRKNLAGKYANYEAFRYTKNCVNPQKVFSMQKISEKRKYEGQIYIIENELQQQNFITGKLIPFIPPYDTYGNPNYRFITVGRPSPEKNHENLIYAFNKLKHEISNTYLYIVGSGPLYRRQQNIIQSLGLEKHIIMTGQINNPISIMKNCDCFILPSLHEGQPMVIHEARLLQMPIICSEFSSANDIKLNKGQYMIGTEQEDIYEGMKAFIDGKVPNNYVFDWYAYNKEACKEFIAAIT